VNATTHSIGGIVVTDERSVEADLLDPKPKWYYLLLKGTVTQDPGPDRMGPYDTEEEARHALQLAGKRNDEWEEEDAEWNGKK
jgi:hypothetical protein